MSLFIFIKNVNTGHTLVYYSYLYIVNLFKLTNYATYKKIKFQIFIDSDLLKNDLF